MPIAIVRATPKQIRVRIETNSPTVFREWVIDRHNFGGIGAIQAVADNGDRCTIGNFRTKDGSAMQPEYAKLRSMLRH